MCVGAAMMITMFLTIQANKKMIVIPKTLAMLIS
jgi:hypothetical protein